MFFRGHSGFTSSSLNESPSEKEGKCHVEPFEGLCYCPLNESPSEKEGK